MNETQRAEAVRLADERPTSISDDLYAWALDADKLLRTLATEPEKAPEPVAFRVDWGIQSVGMPRFFGVDDKKRMDNHIQSHNFPYVVVPLYTHPPKAEPAPEPVAWLAYDGSHRLFIVRGDGTHDIFGGFPVYTQSGTQS
jgi:hypothetical protein